MIPDSDLLTQAALARALGISKPAVSVGIKHGRLVRSVQRDSTGTLKVINLDAAIAEWHANGDYTDTPHLAPSHRLPRPAAQTLPAATSSTPAVSKTTGVVTAHAPDPSEPNLQPGASVSEAAAAEKFWKARSAELTFRRDAAELVPAADVQSALIEVFASCRTKLLGLPSRARQLLPHLSLNDIAALEDLVREACEGLSRTGPESPP